ADVQCPSAASVEPSPETMKLTIMPGPAFWAAVAVRTKIPVPMTAPIPSKVSWKAPSERLSDFFSAVARISSSGLTRPRLLARGATVAILLPFRAHLPATLTTAVPKAIHLRQAVSGRALARVGARRRYAHVGAGPPGRSSARYWR